MPVRYTGRRRGSAVRYALAGGLGWALVLEPLRAQDDDLDFSLDGVLERADELLNENLPGQELVLPVPDPAQMDAFLRQLQAQLEGEYVLDLAPFKRTADFLLPLLEAHEPLRDIGAWLRARRDYFEVIDQLTVIIPPAVATNSPVATNTAGASPGNPSVLTEPSRPVAGIPPGAVVTNRVSVEVHDLAEEEPPPVKVVVVPVPALAPVPTPRAVPGAARFTNRVVAVPPAPRPVGAVGLRPDNPAPETIRTVWSRQLAGRDLPSGARQWVPQLKPVFVAEGVPGELVWLAEVESGFQPAARSPAGAVGLYQLMPVTARSLGLGTFPFDQRKSPEKSARAAARYLRQLYGQFQEWSLALAAYNAGPSRVRSLLTSQQATTFAAIARRLPVETQLYVPKFDVVLRLREGRGLSDLSPAVALPETDGGK